MELEWSAADNHVYMTGPATEAQLNQPFHVHLDGKGGLLVAEAFNHCVRRIDLATGRITTVAGTGKKGYSGDGGAATAAKLNEPYEVRFDSAGNMLFVEMQNHTIRRVDAKSGRISTIAGTGEAGYSGDGGPATKAQFKQPHSIALDKQDNIYVADIGNAAVMVYGPDGAFVRRIGLWWGELLTSLRERARDR